MQIKNISGEITQQLTMLADLVEETGSIGSTYIAHNYPQLQVQRF